MQRLSDMYTRMISDFFHPDVGGVENHIYMLSAELLRRGHKVIVITHSHPPDRVGIRWLLPGIKVYHIPFKTIARSATLPNFFTFLPYFRTIILRERIQIVHAHASLSSLGHEGIMHAHHLGVRTVLIFCRVPLALELGHPLFFSTFCAPNPNLRFPA